MICVENEPASGRRQAPPKEPSNTALDEPALTLAELYDDPAVLRRVGNVIAGAVRRAAKS
jgi:hypothetical protein